MKEKVLQSEHERDTVQSKLDRNEREIVSLKAAHRDITADMKSKIKKLTRRVKLVNTIENALLELYFEIRDRSMDDFSDANAVSTFWPHPTRRNPSLTLHQLYSHSRRITTCDPRILKKKSKSCCPSATTIY